MTRRFKTAQLLALCCAGSGCSLLFATTETELTRDLVSTIGPSRDFASFDDWHTHRQGDLRERQVMRIERLGGTPGTQHILQAQGACGGTAKSIRANAIVTDLLIMDLAPGSTECESGDLLLGSGDVRLKVTETLPRGVTETLIFEGGDVTGPLIVRGVQTDNDATLELRAGVSHHGLTGQGITISNAPNTSDFAVVIETEHTRIVDFEIKDWMTAETTDGFSAIRVRADSVEIESVLIHGDGNLTASKADGITSGGEVSGTTIRNSFLFGLTRAGIHYGWDQPAEDSEPMLVENCSLRGCTLFTDAGGQFGCISYKSFPLTVVNTIAIVGAGKGESFHGNLTPESHHNAADDSLAKGLPAYTANGDHLVSEMDLHLLPSATELGGCAERRGGFSRDIDGEERGAVWSIGADQILSKGASCE